MKQADVEIAGFQRIVKNRAKGKHHQKLTPGNAHGVEPKSAADVYTQLPAYQHRIGDGGHQKTQKRIPLDCDTPGIPHSHCRKEGGQCADQPVQRERAGESQVEDQSADAQAGDRGGGEEGKDAQRFGKPALADKGG